MKKTIRHPKFTASITDEGGYFSLTGNIDGSSGAVGETLAKIYPPLLPIEKMHLSDCRTGQPIHCVANGECHYKETFKKSGMIAAEKRLEDYWHITLDDDDKTRLAVALSIEPMPHEQDEVKNTIRNLAHKYAPVWEQQARDFYTLAAQLPERITLDNDEPAPEFDNEEKARAIADYAGCEVSEVSEVSENENVYTAFGIDYLVLDDDEADAAQEKSIDNYIDECVLSEIPEAYWNYFDRDRLVNDAKQGGRGHTLARYDGHENEIADPETGNRFFAYRV